jgi:hypothetical protein
MKICLVLFSFSSLGFGQVNTGYPLVDAKMAAIQVLQQTQRMRLQLYQC